MARDASAVNSGAPSPAAAGVWASSGDAIRKYPSNPMPKYPRKDEWPEIEGVGVGVFNLKRNMNHG
jgi:hypothetical protein